MKVVIAVTSNTVLKIPRTQPRAEVGAAYVLTALWATASPV